MINSIIYFLIVIFEVKRSMMFLGLPFETTGRINRHKRKAINTGWINFFITVFLA